VDRKFLPIYLNDHLAGSLFGTKLAERIVEENEDNEYGREMEPIVEQIADDRRTLREVMDRLDVREHRIRLACGRVTELISRLKPNGKLVGYSPLSRVMELEGLVMGITGKLELWRALGRLDEPRLRAIDFGELARSAEAQRDKVEDLRLRAAREAFAGSPAETPDPGTTAVAPNPVQRSGDEPA
jgi:hypothetical protein